jgi:hypothetical protein
MKGQWKWQAGRPCRSITWTFKLFRERGRTTKYALSCYLFEGKSIHDG